MLIQRAIDYLLLEWNSTPIETLSLHNRALIVICIWVQRNFTEQNIISLVGREKATRFITSADQLFETTKYAVDAWVELLHSPEIIEIPQAISTLAQQVHNGFYFPPVAQATAITQTYTIPPDFRHVTRVLMYGLIPRIITGDPAVLQWAIVEGAPFSHVHITDVVPVPIDTIAHDKAYLTESLYKGIALVDSQSNIVIPMQSYMPHPIQLSYSDPFADDLVVETQSCHIAGLYQKVDISPLFRMVMDIGHALYTDDTLFVFPGTPFTVHDRSEYTFQAGIMSEVSRIVTNGEQIYTIYWCGADCRVVYGGSIDKTTNALYCGNNNRTIEREDVYVRGGTFVIVNDALFYTILPSHSSQYTPIIPFTVIANSKISPGRHRQVEYACYINQALGINSHVPFGHCVFNELPVYEENTGHYTEIKS